MRQNDSLADGQVVVTHHSGVSDAPLVEFAMAGLLHFLKQVPRLQHAQVGQCMGLSCLTLIIGRFFVK